MDEEDPITDKKTVIDGVSYTISGDGEVSFDGKDTKVVEIVNTAPDRPTYVEKQAGISVHKKWIVNDKSKIPSSIKVRLYQVIDNQREAMGDNLRDTGKVLELNPNNGWSGKFENLLSDKDSLEYRYVVKEEGESTEKGNSLLRYIVYNGLKFIVDRELYISSGSDTTIINRMEETDREEYPNNPNKSENPNNPDTSRDPNKPNKSKNPNKDTGEGTKPQKPQKTNKETPAKKFSKRFPSKLPRTSDISMVGIVITDVISIGVLALMKSRYRN